MSDEEKSLGTFLGLSGRAEYECPECGRSAPYSVENMAAKGGITCPRCRVEREEPPLMQRVEEVEA